MRKFYNKFTGVKKTGQQCKINDCKKDLIVTDLSVSNGENICIDCFNLRNKKTKK